MPGSVGTTRAIKMSACVTNVSRATNGTQTVGGTAGIKLATMQAAQHLLQSPSSLLCCWVVPSMRAFILSRIDSQVCIVLYGMACVRRSGTGVTGLRMGQNRCARGQSDRQDKHKNFSCRLSHTLRPQLHLSRVDEKGATAEHHTCL